MATWSNTRPRLPLQLDDSGLARRPTSRAGHLRLARLRRARLASLVVVPRRVELLHCPVVERVRRGVSRIASARSRTPDAAMTPPATGTALLILIAFVLPGFVAVLLKERLYEVRGEESTFDRLLTTVYYSLLVYLLPALAVGLLSAFDALERADLTRFFQGQSPLWLIGLVAIGVLLVLPACAALGAWWWMNSDPRAWIYEKSDRLKAERRTQTSWDFAFDHEQDLLLVVELKDG